MDRQEIIRRALEDIETIQLCELIVNTEVMYPIRKEVSEIFQNAQKKRGYVPGFYKIQMQETGHTSEEDL
jgi:hypothetical protein